ncbi:MAG: CopG family transcriptional regulator [Methylococcales bacterium]|nr:CopG family transcriptional regulator [Methylococcales bacterium]
MLTLRLDSQLEQTIKILSQQMGISKSELIRKSILEFIDRSEAPSAWTLGEGVFGNHTSGQGNLSKDRKRLLKEQLLLKMSK